MTIKKSGKYTLPFKFVGNISALEIRKTFRMLTSFSLNLMSACKHDSHSPYVPLYEMRRHGWMSMSQYEIKKTKDSNLKRHDCNWIH